MSSPNLAEVDVEAQLKKAEESGDNESIVLSEKSDNDDDDDDDDDNDGLHTKVFSRCRPPPSPFLAKLPRSGAHTHCPIGLRCLLLHRVSRPRLPV